MLKKIAMGALLTGLVAVLILGAVNRTNAVSGEGAGETGRRGQTTEVAAANEATGRGGRWAQGGAAEQAQAGQESTPSGIPQADVQPAEWRTVEGIVVSVAPDLVEIQTAAGEIIPHGAVNFRHAHVGFGQKNFRQNQPQRAWLSVHQRFNLFPVFRLRGVLVAGDACPRGWVYLRGR